MGFFGNRKSLVEELQGLCSMVTQTSLDVRGRADRSLRGKYEYMPPEERAELLREAHQLSRQLHATLESARTKQASMEKRGCASEDIMAAESLLLSASLDSSKADKALLEARDSLLAGVDEVEQFYGPKSKEARRLRKVLSQFQASA